MKSKTLCLILTPILLAAFIIITSPEIKAQELPIWTGNAYSATGEPISTPTLTSGTEYQIVASTIFWYNYSGNLQADAQYYSTDTADYNWTNYDQTPNGHSFLQINGSDVNWGAFSNAETNHTYSISFIGTGNPITFQVYDWIDQDISNNYCHIEISIYEISPPSSTPTPTPSPSPTPTETPTSTPSPTDSPTPSPTPTQTISPTTTPTPQQHHHLPQFPQQIRPQQLLQPQHHCPHQIQQVSIHWERLNRLHLFQQRFPTNPHHHCR